jgi:phosphoribosylglycinamide formyltransferase-1
MVEAPGTAGGTRRVLRVAVLISGRGSNLQALIDRFVGKLESPVEIVRVISNRPDAQGLERAKVAGLATTVIDHKTFPDRAAFDAALDAEIRAAGAQLVVLAGFMRLLTEQFIDDWRDRLINIHPALLPSFRGLDTHRRVLKRGAKLHGCTVHFVRHEMDTGPIVAQAALPVLANDTPETLAARVLELEHRLYPLALTLIAEGRVEIDGDRAVVDAPGSGVLVNPRDRA